MKTVKSYTEYTKLLKAAFDGCEKMPEQRDIQLFIDSNSLYDDWKILVSDVSQDIRTLILKPKAYNGSPKKKRISSYKQYLEKLQETFGIPETMPESSQILTFIDEYELFRVWGITEEDVSKDLQSFIDGKYEEMYKDTTPVYKPVTRVVIKSRPIAPVTSHKAYPIPPFTYIPQTRVYSPPATKHEIPKSEEKPKQRKTVGRKPAVKVKAKQEKQETIFLDGDNHFKEGQKGIERLSKKTKVRAVFSQPGAKRKFDNKYGNRPNVSSKLVEPGNQAVDNQIKAEAGQLLKKGNQDITFVSHDSDFSEYRDRKKNRRDGNSITVVKSVKDRTPKKK